MNIGILKLKGPLGGSMKSNKYKLFILFELYQSLISCPTHHYL